jgi:hypothetical protein
MSEIVELHKLHTANREKLTYFLMASAGAAIGFAITLEQTLPFSWPSVLVISSITIWALSFWSGIWALTYTRRFLYVNAKYLETKFETRPELHADLKKAATEISLDPLSSKIERCEYFQLYSLVLGATFMLVWRIAMAYPMFNLFRWAIELVSNWFS